MGWASTPGPGLHFEESNSVEEATAATMRTTGRALLFTTVVLTSAFSIYGFASAATVVNFGLLSALAVLLAFVFDIFLSPALLALVYRRQEHAGSDSAYSRAGNSESSADSHLEVPR
jgi:multidrug efflux pump subunit AcrB